jgi:hypothetical protein
MALPAAVMGRGTKDEEGDEGKINNSFCPIERKTPFYLQKVTEWYFWKRIVTGIYITVIFQLYFSEVVMFRGYRTNFPI